MAFSRITKIEQYTFYLDTAISRAKKEILSYKTSIKEKDHIDKIKRIEERRIDVISQNLVKPLDRIVKEFPSFDNLTEFYKELIKIETGLLELKKALATLKWITTKVKEFSRVYTRNIKISNDIKRIQDEKKKYLGRISSLFKKNKDLFRYLDECRVVFERFPAIKDGLYTVAISGFPNVGKSTLLSKITSSKPKIENYAFTTRTLLVGYNSETNHKIQFIDTPGTLNRADSENHIERMSYCAIKYACDIIVFVFDPIQYPYEKQQDLLKRLDLYSKDIIVYVSKSDIVKEEAIELKKKIIDKNKNIKKVFIYSDELIKEIQKNAESYMR